MPRIFTRINQLLGLHEAQVPELTNSWLNRIRAASTLARTVPHLVSLSENKSAWKSIISKDVLINQAVDKALKRGADGAGSEYHEKTLPISSTCLIIGLTQ